MGQAAENTPDIPSIMAEIRARVKADLAKSKDRERPFRPTTANIDGGVEMKAGHLLHSEELRNLNRNHTFSLNLNPSGIISHRGGPIGKLIVKLKRKLLTMIRDSLLKDYLASEHQFNSNLVRYLNEIAKYVDNRDAANFWELVRKIDVDVTKAIDRVERINDEQTATLRTTQREIHESLNAAMTDNNRHIESLQRQAGEQGVLLASVDRAVKGLESIAAQLGKAGSSSSAASTEQPTDRSYLLFENRFRGSEADIAARLGIYPQVFAGSKNPVLEIGPGRGELQRLFKERGVPSYGVDTDQAMVEAATALGHKVTNDNGIAHLRSLPNSSIGGVIAVQVIEHLPADVLKELIMLARSKVSSGGKVVFETINPQSMLALSSNYFRDPTHVAPQHPDTIKYMMELHGFVNCEIRYLSPVPAEAQLKLIDVGEFMTPRWADTVGALNENIRRLNTLLFGFQDYCIIAQVP